MLRKHWVGHKLRGRLGVRHEDVLFLDFHTVQAFVRRTRLVEELGRDKGQAQERAVDVQITRLRRKLESDPKQPRYLQTVRGAGYMLAPD